LLQDLSEINGDNLKNVKCEARHFKNINKEYLKEEINELATNGKNKNIRDLYMGINKFKRGYQPTNNLVKGGNGNQPADSHNILNRWRNYFSQLLNVHSASDVTQREVHRAEPLIPGSSHLEVEIAIAKLKKYSSPGSGQVPAERIQVGGETLVSVIHKLIHSIWDKEELLDQLKCLLLYQFTKR
jgi:hypothetical protein